MLRLIYTIFILSTGFATAQSSFDDFLSDEEAASPEQQQLKDDLRNFTEILNGTDRTRAGKALEFMLAHEKDEIFGTALEYGIFGTQPEFRNQALEAVFNRRDQHRIIFDVSEARQERDYSEVLRFNGGSLSADGKTAMVTVTINDFDPEMSCWTLASRSDLCAFILTGDSVSLRDWQYVTGDLKLNDEGEMVGAIQYRGGTPFPARMSIVYD